MMTRLTAEQRFRTTTNKSDETDSNQNRGVWEGNLPYLTLHLVYRHVLSMKAHSVLWAGKTGIDRSERLSGVTRDGKCALHIQTTAVGS